MRILSDWNVSTEGKKMIVEGSRGRIVIDATEDIPSIILREEGVLIWSCNDYYKRFPALQLQRIFSSNLPRHVIEDIANFLTTVYSLDHIKKILINDIENLLYGVYGDNIVWHSGTIIEQEIWNELYNIFDWKDVPEWAWEEINPDVYKWWSFYEWLEESGTVDHFKRLIEESSDMDDLIEKVFNYFPDGASATEDFYIILDEWIWHNFSDKLKSMTEY